jgi:hypothetical protein
MSTLVLILLIAALVFGIVAIVEARGRSWAGWGVVCLAVALLLPRFL